MAINLRARATAIALGVLLTGCTAAEPEAVESSAEPPVAVVTPAPTPTSTPTSTSTPAPAPAPSTSTEPVPAPPPPTAPVEPAPAPAPPPPEPPPPAEELLSREEAEAVLIDTVAAEVGVPRFIVSRYIAANGGLEAVARDNGVSEADIARLDAGVTRSELDEALGPLVDQIEQRLAEG